VDCDNDRPKLFRSLSYNFVNLGEIIGGVHSKEEPKKCPATMPIITIRIKNKMNKTVSLIIAYKL